LSTTSVTIEKRKRERKGKGISGLMIQGSSGV
jgi:hypothetical protein